MGKGKPYILRRQNKGIRAIAGDINRRKICVDAYIKSSRNTSSPKRPGKAKMLSIIGFRTVIRIAGRCNTTARDIVAETEALVSIRRTERTL